MRNYRFDFVHSGKVFTCFASCTFNACILFMAAMIKAGNNYEIEECIMEDMDNTEIAKGYINDIINH